MTVQRAGPVHIRRPAEPGFPRAAEPGSPPRPKTRPAPARSVGPTQLLQGGTSNEPSTLSRIGAACGAVFAIVLAVATGDGSQTFSGPRAVAGIAALTLAVPFIAYLCGVLRRPRTGRLAGRRGVRRRDHRIVLNSAAAPRN